MLLCYNERPKVEGHPYTIMTTVSEDEGRTWSEPQCLYTAGETRADGCWEPVALQYPDGEVQIFFANEAPYTETNEQEISMISTRDPKKVYTVSFRANARDGMSVPCLLNDGKTVVIAIEDSRWNDEPGRMKPVILTSSVRSRWTGSTVSADSSRRHYALKEPLPADTYLGAPYIVQMPTGITVLSAQLENQYGVQQMMVYLGDEKAGDFVNGSKPFLLSRAAPSMWNSLFVKDENTVTAVSQTKIDGTNGIWIIDGKSKDYRMKKIALTTLFAAVAFAAVAGPLSGLKDVRYLGDSKWREFSGQYSSDGKAEAKVLWTKPALDDFEMEMDVFIDGPEGQRVSCFAVRLRAGNTRATMSVFTPMLTLQCGGRLIRNGTPLRASL